MRARSFALLLPLAVLSAMAPACSQTPTLVPLRSMERPRDVDFICLHVEANGSWTGASLEKCAVKPDGSATGDGTYRLHSVVTQVSRGELAVIDLGTTPTDTSATLLKVDPRIPGYSFLPTVATPIDVVADPGGSAVFVASGRDPRIDVIPAGILRGPIDTTLASKDPPPWPHLDFDKVNDGTPGAMSIVREGDARRLYVTLPEAKGGPKIAVFGLGESVVPAFVGTITLTAGSAPALPWKKIGCGQTDSTVTWWNKYDVCAGEEPKIPTGFSSAADTTDMHFAGVAAGGGKLFVADDHADFIHVFSVEGGTGVEERRIPIGSRTSKLSVSPVVPDEVTLDNALAIETCYVRGWLGDGLDHTADDANVGAKLKGRCRAHRYLYAIDLVNPTAGSGTIAIVDLPVIFFKTGTTTREVIDLAGAELVQPMACDAPSFPGRRLPLGPFGVNLANAVPARAVAFVQNDPAPGSGTFVPQARCRPTNLSASELASAPDRDARIAAGNYWRDGIDPSRMRGTYAWVALENGAVVAVDIDDYDALCRGPADDKTRGTVFLRDDEGSFAGFADKARTGEYYPRAVQRHHVRSNRLFMSDTLAPAVSTVVLSRFDTAISNDPSSLTGKKYPHFAALESKAADATSATVVLTAPDNPFAITNETWSSTFEGAIPGFTGAFGALSQSTSGLTFTDTTVGFCGKGVETRGAAVETHDVVQLIDAVCPFDDSCTAAQRTECLSIFGASDATPLRRERSLLIDKAFDDKLVLANKHFKSASEGSEDYTIIDGAADYAKILQCFGRPNPGDPSKRVLPLLRYVIRANGNVDGAAPWVVTGSSTGYTHRWIVDATSTDKACVLDKTKPRILDARAPELPTASFKNPDDPLNDPANIVDAKDHYCSRFVNASWQFAIRRGEGKSLQDMRLTFIGRFNWTPFSVGAGSLSASMRPVSGWWDGTEHLGWSMIAVVDAIDRGLFMFPAQAPYSFQKAVN